MPRYFSLSHLSAGFIAVMVGFTSSVVLVFQAATAAGATQAELSSWLFALGLSIGITCIGLSLRYRMPILIGWSTPGAALLATSLSGFSMAEAIGAFIVAALLTIVGGMSGFFERIIVYIPRSLTSAMLAGILLNFGLNVFTALEDQLLLISAMLFTYLMAKRLAPRAVIILVLIIGICVAELEGLFHLESFTLAWPTPRFTLPEFSWTAILSIGIPLFIVNMTSQNIPGIAILNASGYKLPISSTISWTGWVNLLFAPLGCYSISLTALTAAICTSPEADLDPQKRYRATVFAGFCWFVVALFGASLVTLLVAFPKELILGLAGLALLGTIGSSLKTSLEEDKQREPALITVLISASGISVWGVGAACWGLVGGIAASFILNWTKKESLAQATAA